MELKGFAQKLPEWINKYKLVILITLLGCILMIVPFGNKSKAEPEINTAEKTEDAISIQDELAGILSNIDGAGKVQVMLTIAQGEETIYQTNDSHTNENQSLKENKDTVTITDAERNQEGLVRQKNPPRYMGAIIVCQGADNPVVRYAITEAVAKITGLKLNQISVLKMK